MKLIRNWRPNRRNLIKLVFVLVVGSLAIKTYVIDDKPFYARNVRQGKLGDEQFRDAFDARMNNQQVHGEGQVVHILDDDLEGSRHQRFILRLSSGQTLLVAHNIDLAPRVDDLRTNDYIEFFGEYEWNEAPLQIASPGRHFVLEQREKYQ